jgi:hypothetical protein
MQVSNMEDFRSVPEEVENLLKEIEATRDTLKAVSSRLAAIEKHVRRAFQVPKPPKKAARPSRSASSLNRDQLLARFDEIRSRAAATAESDDDTVLGGWADEDLRALAAELGASNTKKLSLVKIRSLIMQKVRESVMLGTDTLRGIQQHGPRDPAVPGSDTESDA